MLINMAAGPKRRARGRVRPAAMLSGAVGPKRRATGRFRPAAMLNGAVGPKRRAPANDVLQQTPRST